MDIGQHNQEIHENAIAWDNKPLLQRAYADFYGLIAQSLKHYPSGLTAELGSGLGKIKTVIPDCITTDLFANPWIDLQENAYFLSFGDGALENLILFDVFHHLKYPGAALREFCRVIRPGGRLVVFEPAMSALGKIVYGLFHHEPLGLANEIIWDAPGGFDPDKHTYYAAQGNCSRVFESGAFADRLVDWEIVEIKKLPALAYVASGGFKGPQLYPTRLYPLVRALERLLACFPRVFATRMLVVLEKKTFGI